MSNELKCVSILDIPFLNKTKASFLKDDLYPRLLNEEKTFIVTANPEIVMEAYRNKPYKHAIQRANYIVPDGVGVLLAARWRKTPLIERITGYDLMLDLLAFANENKLRCFLIGAKKEINKKAVEKVKQHYPNLIIAGHHHGYFDIQDEKIVQRIKDTNPDLVFVALGYPKQELWIHKHIKKFKKGTFIGVGGSFDVLAGYVKRAPRLWISLNLEWLYRLLQQPSRIFRMLKILKFLVLSFLKRKE